jgi:hypothetical protein
MIILRKDLLDSLNKRFNSLIESDLCLVSSFLDPRFGAKVFSADKREFVKARVRYHLALINPRSNNVKTCSFSTNIPTQFIFHEVENESGITSFDDY